MTQEDTVDKVVQEMKEQNLFPRVFINLVKRYLYMTYAAGYDYGRHNVYRRREVIQYDQLGTLLNRYPSTMEASRVVQAPHQNIIACCQGKRHSVKGFIFKYKQYETRTTK